MHRYHPYIFGFPDGIPPEVRKQKIEDAAFENFLENILGKRNYQRRNQMRLIEEAVSQVIDGILIRQ